MEFFEMESGEWSRVNKELRQHGLPPIELAHPKHADSLSDMVVFDAAAGKRLRDSLYTLMRDCDRRQELLQELIATNNQLRTELREQTAASERLRQRLNDDSSSIIQNNGDDDLFEELQVETRRLRRECDEWRAKCKKQESTLQSVTHRLALKTQQDEQIQKQQKCDSVQQLKNSVGGKDPRIVEIIDSYERRLCTLKQELERYRPSSRGADTQCNKELDESPSISNRGSKPSTSQPIENRHGLKALKLENEVELLKLELDSRPTVKDLRDAQTRIKRLEAIIKRKNLGEKMNSTKPHYSTHLDDLKYLSVENCRHYLTHICVETRVEDLDDVVPRIKKLQQFFDARPHLEKFASDVLSIVDQEDVPVPAEFRNRRRSRQPDSPAPAHAVYCEKNTHHVIPTLHYWVLQLQSLKELQQSLTQLQKHVLPWRKEPVAMATGSPCPGSSQDAPVTVTALIAAVDNMIEDEQNTSQISVDKDQTTSTSPPAPRSLLQGIVDHFMNLFDVSKVTGCYARMNDIYSKLGEVHNVLKTLRNLLNLAPDARCCAVVDGVAGLVEATADGKLTELKKVVGDQDLCTVIEKLKAHDNFFPVFQSIINKVMDLLNVNRADQIIPAVRALKLLCTTS